MELLTRIESLETDLDIDPESSMTDEELFELSGVRHIPFKVPEKK